MASNDKKSRTRTIITYVSITLAALALLFLFALHMRSQIATVYELEVEGLSAQTPDQAQSLCRADYDYYAELAKEYEGYCWVWCGDDMLYVVKSDALVIDPEGTENAGFTKVTFKGDMGKKLSGYLIDPTQPPELITQIELGEAKEYTYQNVSMSIRVKMRDGTLAYEDASYLWEKGSSTVYVVRTEAVTVVEGRIASFTDDGGVTRVCYILDTDLG